ncbi:MAG: hypothetical protein GY808_10895, partial [Gammaproteobacteria bacterium]|nr:hypothetical protein [Gammaproteobacteria bacterium]
VGIGTITPQTMLEVADTIRSSFGGFQFPDGTVQETAVLGGGVSEINDLTDGITDATSVFIGAGAGQNDDGNSNRNTATGNIALNSNIDGASNVAFGFGALYQNTTGDENVGIGYGANYLNQDGSQNTIIGTDAGFGASSHSKSGSVFLGYRAGYNETSDNKLYIENSNSSTPLIWGDFAADSLRINGDLHITGDIHIDGTGAGASEIDGLNDGISDGSSVFLGFGAGVMDDGTNNRNTGIGIYALRFNTSGYSNTAYGYSSLYNNSSGYFNTAAGFNALFDNSNGHSNTANGYSALSSNTNGDANLASGYFALLNNTIGSYNVGLGAEANLYNQAGSNNTIIGYQAGRGSSNHTKSGNVFLGHQAGYNEYGSNKLYIENSNSITPLIWGDFSADSIRIHGNLHVTGNIQSDGSGGEVSEINDLTDGKTGGNSVFLGSGAGASDDGSNNNNSALG